MILWRNIWQFQNNRGHTVSDSGPYRDIRHPGYLGMIIYHLSTPIILGSLWALIPTLLIVILFIIHTVFEDNMLKNKIEGFRKEIDNLNDDTEINNLIVNVTNTKFYFDNNHKKINKKDKERLKKLCEIIYDSCCNKSEAQKVINNII